MEILSAISGKCRRTILTNPGQQEVTFFSPALYASTHSAASEAAVISPPNPASINPLNPTSCIAFFQLPIVMFAPNCPSVAGAAITYTFLSDFKALMTSTIDVLDPIAPNGQLWIHFPQRIHLESSITEIPYSLYVIALTGHANLHGLFKCAIAL